MCQLLGMNSSAAASIRFSFTGFAQRGGCTADHIDGWGIAFYEPSGARSFLDDRPASESRLADFVREHPIRSHNVISHIRKATQGRVRSAASGWGGTGSSRTTAICRTSTRRWTAATCPRAAPTARRRSAT